MTEQKPGQEERGPDDRELEDFLAGRGPLSRAHREGAREQAPPELDAKVLAAAREELRRARPTRRLLRWDGPLALAASMLLVVSLGWLMQRPVPRPGLGEAAPESMATPVAAPSAANNRWSVPSPPKPPSLASREKKRSAEASKTVEPTTKPAAPAKPMAAPFADTAGPGNAESLPPAPAAAGAVMDQPSAVLAEQAGDRQIRRDKALPQDAAPAPASTAPQAKAAASFANSSAAAARADASGSQSDPCASSRRQPAQLQARPEQNLDAPAWLDQIRHLRDADPPAARAELACFVVRKPLAEVPEDLQPLLQTGSP